MFASTSGRSIAGFRIEPRSPPVQVTTWTSTPSATYLAVLAAPLLDSSSGWAWTCIRRSMGSILGWWGECLCARSVRAVRHALPGPPPAGRHGCRRARRGGPGLARVGGDVPRPAAGHRAADGLRRRRPARRGRRTTPSYAGTRAVAASCLLRASADDHSTVGRADRAGAARRRRRWSRCSSTVRTERRATTVDLVGCTSAGQRQARAEPGPAANWGGRPRVGRLVHLPETTGGACAPTGPRPSTGASP